MSMEHFDKTLNFILQHEGGYVNDPNDLGGETNKGITYRTYSEFRKNKGLKPQSVRYISNDEVREIYYNNYYKASGADKIADPKLSAYVFDTAVNMGVSRARLLLNQSGGSAEKFEQLRKAKYEEFARAIPSQKRYLQGWNNRVNDLKNFSEKTFSDNVIKTNTKSGNYAKSQQNSLKIDYSSINASNFRFINKYKNINNRLYDKIIKTLKMDPRFKKYYQFAINGK